MARRAERSQIQRTLFRARRNVGFLGGAAAVSLLVLLALLGPLVSPADPLEMNTRHRLESPSTEFWFGTDEFGRDMLSRVIAGARYSLSISLPVVLLGGLAGTMLGLLAGYRRGWVDEVLMRLTDILLAFPNLLLALAMIAILGTSKTNLIWTLAIVYTPVFARMVRGPVLAIREEAYVEVARSVGASQSRIMLRHVLPNVVPIILIQFTLSLGGVLLTEATLSFLGLGAQPPEASWGVMVSTSRRFMEVAPWTAVFPAFAIVVAVLGFSFLGDGLQDIRK
jgi:peptide/nickel transport system permease protein